MQSRGFTLLEMVLVLAVSSILLTIATLNFREFARRYQTEAQTRLLFGELLKARVNAICQRRGVRVKIYPTRFEVYSTQQDGGTTRPLQTHPLNFPIICNKAWDPTGGFALDFEPNGLAEANLSICLESGTGSGAVDSIKVYRTRVSIGKKDKGDECDSENITSK